MKFGTVIETIDSAAVSAFVFAWGGSARHSQMSRNFIRLKSPTSCHKIYMGIIGEKYWGL